MLRRTACVHHYRAKFELDRIRGMLRGRARLERKVGLKRLFFLMRTQTRYRVEQQAYWERAIVRKNVDSAAREHGTGWPHLRNELGRQNVILLPRSQQLLAQYEPLAFRAVLELCASRIPPPPPPIIASVPEEAYVLWPPVSAGSTEGSAAGGIDSHSQHQQQLSPHPAARLELRRGVERILHRGGSSLGDNVDELLESWREFDVSKAKNIGIEGVMRDSTHPDQQMNHVGFCIGMTCLTERFLPSASRAASPVEEIRLSHSIITLCNPFSDLWIAVETTTACNSSLVLPLVRLGLDAFVLRYGMDSIATLVRNPREVCLGEDVGAARAALRDHFESFAVLLQTSVLVVDPDASHPAVQKSTDLQLSSRQQSRRSSLSSIISTEVGISPCGGSRTVHRWRRHLSTLAATGSLLTFPVMMRATPQDLEFMCHSIVLRHLSFLSAGVERRQTSCWGRECHGVPSNVGTGLAMQGADERLLWTCCRYVVFIGKTLKVVVSNVPQDMISQLMCLFLMDPELPSFTLFRERVPLYCCVYRSESLLTAVICDECLHNTMHTPLFAACKRLTDCITECLSRVTSPVARTVGISDGTDVHRVRKNQSAFPSFTGHNSSASPHCIEPLAAVGKLPNTKSTFQFTLWRDGVLFGSPLQDYFRTVQFALSAPMRRLIKCVRDECRGSRVSVDRRAMECARQSGGLNETLSDANITLRGTNELWVLLPNSTWLCVTRAKNHVGSVVFYNAPPLSSCFKAVESMYESLPFSL